MKASSRLGVRRAAARATARMTPLVASGAVHALAIAAILTVGVHAAPRWRPGIPAELIILERDVVPSAPAPAPRPEPPRPATPPPPTVTAPTAPPRVTMAPTPPRTIETPP